MIIVRVTTGCMALGAISVLILGEFDLSLGYLISFCMMLGAVLSGSGANALTVIVTMIASGAFFGLLSGLLTIKLQISSFISTLGIGMLLFGLTLAISSGEVKSAGIPQSILTIGQGKFLQVGYSVWILMILGFLMHIFLNYTVLGRQLYAVGGSQKVSYLAGVKTDMVRIMGFVLAGTFTGLGAIFQLGQSGAANPSFGPSLLLPAYAIVFLGATAFHVGIYNIKGLMLAIILLGVGVNGINMLGAPTWAEHVYNGGVLILAIYLANRNKKKFA
ncbi:MAG TPA: ABC transporter permease [Syntrophomonas sp.]|nr:ABC transporter permease [Syntrophomonas sp.]